MQGQGKVSLRSLFLPLRFEERVRSRGLKIKMSNPKFSYLLFLSVLLLLLSDSIQLLPSSRKLISTMSCFLVFISRSFPLTCTLLLNILKIKVNWLQETRELKAQFCTLPMEILPPLKHLLLLVQIALVTEHINISSQASGGAVLLTYPEPAS